jgi:putative inorganic carbon (HCO3(-)) transporter
VTIGFGGMDNNSQAIAMVTGVGLAFFLGLEELVLWRKFLAFACAAFMAHAIFFSFSRGGMLSLVFVGIVSFVLVPKRPVNLGLFALGAILALAMGGKEVRNRFETIFAGEEERDASSQSRIDLWKACLDLMQQHPVFGVGPDHFPRYAKLYGFKEGKEAHSLWLQLGAEVGVSGLLFLVGFYGLTTWGLIRLSWQRRRIGEQDLLPAQVMRMVVAGLAGFILAGQFVTLEGLELPYYVAILGAGMLQLISREAHDHEAGVALPQPVYHTGGR